MCQNYQGRNQIGNPEVAEKCARTAQFDWEESGVAQCVGSDDDGPGDEGLRLLHNSIRVTKFLGITCASDSSFSPSISLMRNPLTP